MHNRIRHSTTRVNRAWPSIHRVQRLLRLPQWVFLGAFVLLCGTSIGLQADEVEQHNGTRIIGTVVAQSSDYVVVENKYGTFKILRSKIKSIRIQPGSPTADFREGSPQAGLKFGITEIAGRLGFHLPTGKFREFTNAGLNLITDTTLASYNRHSVALTLGHNISFTTSGPITSFQSIQTGVLYRWTGYKTKKTSLTSAGGLGYFTHVISAKDETKSGAYADPYLAVQLEGGYAYQPNLELFVVPGWNFFFEQEDFGSFGTLGFGARWKL